MIELIDKNELLKTICKKSCDVCELSEYGTDCVCEAPAHKILETIHELPLAYDIEYKAMQIADIIESEFDDLEYDRLCNVCERIANCILTLDK